MFNQKIFRENDIRGIANTDLSSRNVRQMGRAIGTFLKRKGCKIVTLGYDCRISSPRISREIRQSLLSCGLDVWDIALVPTPLSYFSTNALEVDGAIMITASHNPPEYNGVKISLGKTTIYGEDIQEIRRILASEIFESGQGNCRKVDIKEKYIQKVLESIPHPLPIKVVIDSANGMAGMIAPELFRRLGCEVIDLFSNLDGRFPNHEADPTVDKNMITLKEEVKRQNALVGVGFDGDADRLGVIDRTGQAIFGDELLVIFSREVLKNHPNAKIISEVKSSHRLFQDIEKHGGKAIQWKTGHSLIKAKMKEEGALLAGEVSGHMFFADRYFGYDDAIYAAARLFEILARTKKSPAELIADLPLSYSTPEIRKECADHIKFEVIKSAKTEFTRRGLKLNDIDGARIEFPDGWGLVRASNTQPALVMRFEAETQSRLSEIKTLVEEVVQNAILQSSFPEVKQKLHPVESLQRPNKLEVVKFIEKPWGHELIWAKTGRYVGKILFVKAGKSLSLQYHQKKEETLFVESGDVELEVGPTLDRLERVSFHNQKAFHVPPGLIHRVHAKTDARIFEVSTPELDDVVRIQDDFGREDKKNNVSFTKKNLLRETQRPLAEPL